MLHTKWKKNGIVNKQFPRECGLFGLKSNMKWQQSFKYWALNNNADWQDYLLYKNRAFHNVLYADIGNLPRYTQKKNIFFLNGLRHRKCIFKLHINFIINLNIDALQKYSSLWNIHSLWLKFKIHYLSYGFITYNSIFAHQICII